MQLTKSQLSTKLTNIHETFPVGLNVVLIQNKVGEVTWTQIPDKINLTAIRMNLLSHELKVCFDIVLPTVKLETVFRECYEQEDTCDGCRWYDKENQQCAFKRVTLDSWPDVLYKLGYELEDKLW